MPKSPALKGLTNFTEISIHVYQVSLKWAFSKRNYWVFIYKVLSLWSRHLLLIVKQWWEYLIDVTDSVPVYQSLYWCTSINSCSFSHVMRLSFQEQNTKQWYLGPSRRGGGLFSLHFQYHINSVPEYLFKGHRTHINYGPYCVVALWEGSQFLFAKVKDADRQDWYILSLISEEMLHRGEM